RKEAAHQLGIAEAALSSRLERGRSMLAQRMKRHGLAVTTSAIPLALSPKTMALPPALMAATVRAGSLLASGTGAAGALSATVLALTEGVVKTMLLTKLKTA